MDWVVDEEVGAGAGPGNGHGEGEGEEGEASCCYGGPVARGLQPGVEILRRDADENEQDNRLG